MTNLIDVDEKIDPLDKKSSPKKSARTSQQSFMTMEDGKVNHYARVGYLLMGSTPTMESILAMLANFELIRDPALERKVIENRDKVQREHAEKQIIKIQSVDGSVDSRDEI